MRMAVLALVVVASCGHAPAPSAPRHGDPARPLQFYELDQRSHTFSTAGARPVVGTRLAVIAAAWNYPYLTRTGDLEHAAVVRGDHAIDGVYDAVITEVHEAVRCTESDAYTLYTGTYTTKALLGDGPVLLYAFSGIAIPDGASVKRGASQGVPDTIDFDGDDQADISVARANRGDLMCHDVWTRNGSRSTCGLRCGSSK